MNIHRRQNPGMWYNLIGSTGEIPVKWDHALKSIYPTRNSKNVSVDADASKASNAKEIKADKKRLFDAVCLKEKII